jgi:hypothetical protein
MNQNSSVAVDRRVNKLMTFFKVFREILGVHIQYIHNVILEVLECFRQLKEKQRVHQDREVEYSSQKEHE